jgi:hypothetical protein
MTNYQWRPAAKFDIGSIARFSDDPNGPYSFGILTRIFDTDVHIGEGDEQEVTFYQCDFTPQYPHVRNFQTEDFNFCWIQYDANQEP